MIPLAVSSVLYRSISLLWEFFRHSKPFKRLSTAAFRKKKIIRKFSSPPSALHFPLLSLTLLCNEINKANRNTSLSQISEVRILSQWLFKRLFCKGNSVLLLPFLTRNVSVPGSEFWKSVLQTLTFYPGCLSSVIFREIFNLCIVFVLLWAECLDSR